MEYCSSGHGCKNNNIPHNHYHGIKITCAAKKSEGGVNSGGGTSWVEGVTEFQHVWFFWFVGIAKTNLSPDILTQPREKAILEKITQTSLKKQRENIEEKSTTTSVNLIFNLSD